MEKTLAERLRQRRKELGMRQEDVAKAVGVSGAAVAQWETGETKNLRVEHLFRVADALKVHARWLGLGDGPKFVAVLLSLVLPPLLIDAVRWSGCVLCQIASCCRNTLRNSYA